MCISLVIYTNLQLYIYKGRLYVRVVIFNSGSYVKLTATIRCVFNFPCHIWKLVDLNTLIQKVHSIC